MNRTLLRLLVVALLATGAFLTAGVSAGSAAPSAPAAAPCTSQCLRVYSIKMYDYLAADVQANVQVVNENNGLARGAVVHGQWTLPDGSTLDRYDIIGVRGRAEFPLSSSQTGTFTFTVVDITLAGYTFDPAGSALLSNSMDIGTPPPPPGCTSACAHVDTIDFVERSRAIVGKVTVVDETGAAINGAQVSATWTRPDGTTTSVSASTNRRGIANLKVTKNAAGTYTLSITGVTAGGFTYDPGTGTTTASYTVG